MVAAIINPALEGPSKNFTKMSLQDFSCQWSCRLISAGLANKYLKVSNAHVFTFILKGLREQLSPL